MNTRKQGKKAEEIAEEYLHNQGLISIARNFTISGGELDLIMKDGDFIVFIEVKSLRKNSEFYIFETLTNRKKRFLRNAINTWLLQNNFIDQVWRVDFIGIRGDKIEYFKFIDLN